MSTQSSIHRLIFLLVWLFVGFVEVYDVYWSIKLQDVLLDSELNPVGRFLISLDGGDVALFMALKASAIIAILGALPVLLWSNRAKLAWLFLAIIFISRLALFVFLETGHLW